MTEAEICTNDDHPIHRPQFHPSLLTQQFCGITPWLGRGSNCAKSHTACEKATGARNACCRHLQRVAVRPRSGSPAPARHPAQGAALMIAWRWQIQHDTSSERTPFALMLPSIEGSIGSLKRPAAIGKKLRGLPLLR